MVLVEYGIKTTTIKIVYTVNDKIAALQLKVCYSVVIIAVPTYHQSVIHSSFFL